MALYYAGKTLDKLVPGQKGIIRSVGNRSDAVRRRLADLGLIPGTEVSVVRLAPFGDPMELKVRGYELSLRAEDAAQIRIGNTPVFGLAGYDGNSGTVLVESRATPYQGRTGGNRAFYGKRAGLRVALVGNPNCGKTTLFNALTGSNQRVGNWPGVTVERKEGTARIGGYPVAVTDLPGLYSLSPYSEEEAVSRDYIIGPDAPDVMINIVDASHIERGLYLTIQLLELGKPMVVALSFMDEAGKSGDRIDAERLSAALGVPAVPISAKTGKNLDELLKAARFQAGSTGSTSPDGLYGGAEMRAIQSVEAIIRSRAFSAGLPPRWAAVRFIEGDAYMEKTLGLNGTEAEEADKVRREYGLLCGTTDNGTLKADGRYAFISKVVRASVRKGSRSGAGVLSDRIDGIVTNKYLAIPVFLITMFLMFALAFGPPGTFLSGGVSFIIENFSAWLSGVLRFTGASDWIIGLITDGVIAGVGGVLRFLPQIALLFSFLSILEDSGYMARAAFIMDRPMRRFGLSGKAFIPLLMGFGCSVPAVMSARTMENEKDRRMTIMLVPFMSCSARLPVYSIVAPAFFGGGAAPVVLSLYLLGISAAALSGLIFKKTLFSADTAAFVMELPPYRMPSPGDTLTHVWDRLRGFITRAGTVILVMSVVLWFLENFNPSFEMVGDRSMSMLAAVGSFAAPFFRPMGFGTWQASVALITGLIAKEAVAASLGMFYGFSPSEGPAAAAAAMKGFTPLSAYSFLVFVLLYVPCAAAVSTIYHEMKSLKWTALSVAWQIATASAVSAAVYGAGRLLGFG